MKSEEILALYEWKPGACFRHSVAGEVETTVVRTLRPRANGDYPVRACRVCVLAIEAAREEAAHLAGRKYTPGHAGDALE